MKRFSPLIRIILISALAVLVLANIALFLYQGLPLVTAPKTTPTPAATPTPSPTATIDLSLLAAKNTPEPQTTQLPSALVGLQQQGFFVLSMSDGPYYHLFAYNPQYLSFTRLTDNAWDDRDPAISPDGTNVAFSSRKSGYWDIYILDLGTGETTQVTNSNNYDGAPSWSPDGQWLAYESYVNDNMDIYIKSLADLSQPAIQLTDDPALDYSPSWSPGSGRKIAFVSTRSGDSEIWVADLDKVTDRFTDVSNMPGSIEQHPAWSPDGRYLAFASDANGVESIFTWDSQNPQQAATRFAVGDWPFWSSNGDDLSALVDQPNQIYLTTYRFSDQMQVLPLTALPGTISGAAWESGGNINLLAAYINNDADTAPTPTLFQPIITLSPPPGGRFGVVALKDVNAPYAYLQDSVDESFDSLRTAVGQLTGWDFLANLENAYLPLTEPPDPDMPENWLNTGRAIAVNTLPLSADWMTIVREDFNGQPYWRIFLKTRQQDGSQGLPLNALIWDLDTRYSGDPVAYDNGGSLEAPPSGYWVDFTELALRYGWKRIPSLANWRTYYQGMLYNQYVSSDTMDWETAMQELYPPEALATYTPIPSITPTPTVTQTPTRTPTATRTKYVTRTPNFTITPTSP